MNNSLLTVMYCVFLLSVGVVCPVLAGEQSMVRVTRVIDGDSLAVENKGRAYQIRLWGIDSPEWGQSFSSEAKALCRDLVEGRTIEIQEKYRDRFGRVVALVKIDGRVVNEEMIRRGMAWVHIRYCDEEICAVWRQREREARNRGLGLWADPNPLAPWEYKGLKHGKRW
ncbi:MAG: thermonuclease family protein [Desulfoprunum sp.]|nr:thermonuclease family protein [Desulfoprunum sp.]